MTLSIAQRADYQGNDWWHWSVWLEGTEQELREVELVTYVLHPTFPEPVREVRDRETQFRLDSAGWGEFTLEARVQQKGGKPPRRLSHDLKLPYPRSAPKRSADSSPARAGPTVYLSYSSADARVAAAFKRVLRDHGIGATDASDSAGSATSLRASVSKSLASSDAFVVIGSGAPGPWAEWELQKAQAHSIPIIPVQVGAEQRPGELAGSLAVQLSESPDEREIESKIAPIVSQFLPGKGTK